MVRSHQQALGDHANELTPMGFEPSISAGDRIIKNEKQCLGGQDVILNKEHFMSVTQHLVTITNSDKHM